jgi:hypothetical protein
MKNVYAIALGLSDGLEQRAGEPFHNLKAATFAQAVRELGTLCRMVGGRAETAIGLAGVGDLEVTGLSGRNKVYGARIGRGEPASGALQEMAAAEQTVEGVPAARLAKDLVDQRDPAAWPSLPLLTAILGVIDDDPDPVDRIVDAVLPKTRRRRGADRSPEPLEGLAGEVPALGTGDVGGDLVGDRGQRNPERVRLVLDDLEDARQEVVDRHRPGEAQLDVVRGPPLHRDQRGVPGTLQVRPRPPAPQRRTQVGSVGPDLHLGPRQQGGMREPVGVHGDERERLLARADLGRALQHGDQLGGDPHRRVASGTAATTATNPAYDFSVTSGSGRSVIAMTSSGASRPATSRSWVRTVPSDPTSPAASIASTR